MTFANKLQTIAAHLRRLDPDGDGPVMAADLEALAESIPNTRALEIGTTAVSEYWDAVEDDSESAAEALTPDIHSLLDLFARLEK